jgi:hypothetical protein
MKYIIIASTLFLFSGCVKDVKPWEKGKLANPVLKESGEVANYKKYEEHIYLSKEGTKGGGSISGGGCGCN